MSLNNTKTNTTIVNYWMADAIHQSPFPTEHWEQWFIVPSAKTKSSVTLLWCSSIMSSCQLLRMRVSICLLFAGRFFFSSVISFHFYSSGFCWGVARRNRLGGRRKWALVGEKAPIRGKVSMQQAIEKLTESIKYRTTSQQNATTDKQIRFNCRSNPLGPDGNWRPTNRTE